MASKNLAQGESIQIDLDELVSSVVALTSRASNNVGCNLVLEAQIDNEWVTPVTMINPIVNPKVEIAALVGASKAGWADLPGFRCVRVRRTDAAGGDGWAEINVLRR